MSLFQLLHNINKMRHMPTSAVTAAMSYDDIAARVYQGEILSFDGGGKSLIGAARELCRNIFNTSDLTKVHEQHSRAGFLLLAAKAQAEFNTAPYKQHFIEWLRHIGVRPGKHLYWDTLGLRIAAPVSHSGGFRSHVGVHRDTWGAGIQQQINWWAPVIPLSYKRTMAFYPDYWRRKLANTTAQWSFEEYLASRRRAKASGRKASYPSTPQNTEEPVTPPYLVRPSCGELLAFSAAHLHASVVNRTHCTRFSLEIRTVSAAHIKSGKGAPNIDCESQPPLYRLFRSLKDNSHLTVNSDS